MRGAKSTPEQDAPSSTRPASPFPQWRIILGATCLAVLTQDLLQTVADEAYLRGIRRGARNVLTGLDTAPPAAPEPYCNALGTPGCKRELDGGQLCEPDRACYYAWHGPDGPHVD